MRRMRLNCDKLRGTKLLMLPAIAIILMASFPIRAMAQQLHQKTFSSPEDASNALVTAAQSNDARALLDIFGPEGTQIVSSGDEAEDAESRASFVERYRQMHRLVSEQDRQFGDTSKWRGIGKPFAGRQDRQPWARQRVVAASRLRDKLPSSVIHPESLIVDGCIGLQGPAKRRCPQRV